MSVQTQAASLLSGSALEKLQGVEKKRVLRHFNSELTSYSSANSTEVIIDISTPKELLDFNNGYLIFDIVSSATAPGGTLVYNNFAASSWIREMRIEDRSGAQIGKSVNYYNALCRLEYDMKSNDEANSSYLDRLEGAKAFTDNVLNPASSSRQFAHRFISHIFTSPDYFPNNFVSGLRIILTLESAANVIRSTVDETLVSPVYTLSNMSYACDVVELTEVGMKHLQASMFDGGQTGLDIAYMRHANRRTTQFTDTQQFKVGVIDGAIKSMEWYSIRDVERNSAIEDYFGILLRNNLSSYRVFLNNKPLTDKRINISPTRETEFVVEYVKSQKMNLDMAGHGSSQLDLSGKFVFGQRFDRATNDDVISSIRDSDNNEIEIEAEFSQSGSSATTYFFVLTDQQLRILPNREHMDVAVKPQSGLLSTMSS